MRTGPFAWVTQVSKLMNVESVKSVWLNAGDYSGYDQRRVVGILIEKELSCDKKDKNLPVSLDFRGVYVPEKFWLRESKTPIYA